MIMELTHGQEFTLQPNEKPLLIRYISLTNGGAIHLLVKEVEEVVQV
jgi:hypothetical protein